MKDIQWKKGAGVFLLSTMMCLLCLLLMVLIMEFATVNYTEALASTRSDLIADAVAVYAQSYDYCFNERQAEQMCSLLTTYNNASSQYTLTTSISFPSEPPRVSSMDRVADVVTVDCVATTKPYYPELFGTDSISIRKSSTVRSVDIYGDIFVVPGDLAESEARDEMTDLTEDLNSVAGSIDDVETLN